MTQRGIENQRKTKQEDFVCSRVEDGVRGFSREKKSASGVQTHTVGEERKIQRIGKESRGNKPKENKVEIINELN